VTNNNTGEVATEIVGDEGAAPSEDSVEGEV